MKHTSLYFVISFLLLIYLAIPIKSEAHPIPETNDYIEYAQTNTYQNGEANYGSLDALDWDYWQYDLSHSGTLDIELDPEFIDCDWVLYGSQASGYNPSQEDIIAESHQYGYDGDEDEFNLNVLPGNYYIKIYSPVGDIGGYWLRSTFNESNHPISGTDDYTSYASIPTDFDGSPNYDGLDIGDWDYWQYEFNLSGYLDLELDSMSGVDCDWIFTNSNGEIIAESKTTGLGGSDNIYNIQVQNGTIYQFTAVRLTL